MQRSTFYLKVDRASSEVCAAARNVNVSDLHEAMGPTFGRAAMMSEAMRPLLKGIQVAGPAVRFRPQTGHSRDRSTSRAPRGPG